MGQGRRDPAFTVQASSVGEPGTGTVVAGESEVGAVAHKGHQTFLPRGHRELRGREKTSVALKGRGGGDVARGRADGGHGQGGPPAVEEGVGGVRALFRHQKSQC